MIDVILLFEDDNLYATIYSETGKSSHTTKKSILEALYNFLRQQVIDEKKFIHFFHLVMENQMPWDHSEYHGISSPTEGQTPCFRLCVRCFSHGWIFFRGVGGPWEVHSKNDAIDKLNHALEGRIITQRGMEKVLKQIDKCWRRKSSNNR